MKIVANLDLSSNSKLTLSADPSSAQDGATLNYINNTLTKKAFTVSVFTQSGSWNRPTGCKIVKVTVVGGGGKGGGVGTLAGESILGYAGGGGGGGGGTVIAWIDVTGVTYNSATSITVGSGSTTYSSAGGTSSFGSAVYAYGGNSCVYLETDDTAGSNDLNWFITSNATGGNGIISSGTGYIITGGGGALNHTDIKGVGTSYVRGGNGGGTYLAGELLGSLVVAPSAVNGSTGNLYGGGGSGGAIFGVQSDTSGGNGAAGIVIVEEYY